MEKLNCLFNPESIAVIGATNKQGHVGYGVLKNLVGSGYEGIVYPINPNHKSILGVRTYPSVLDIKDKIDLAVITTRAPTVPTIIEQCGQVGIKGLVIISSGFKEVGTKGAGFYREVQRLVHKYGMRVLGPNCLGFLRPSLKLNASFSPQTALPGRVAFISQSGALGTAIIDWANQQKIGFSYFVSIGSMMDIGFADLIDYFGEDPDTSSILIYMESLSNARRFLSAARAFARTKPIVVLKVGTSSQGAKAALSHTGSLTGDDEVFDAAFKRAGILRVKTIGELFDCAKTLSIQRRPRHNRLAIVTNAGGPGVIATDYLISNGGVLAKLSKETMHHLNGKLPPTWSRNNPVDVLGDADAETYRSAIELTLKDSGVDGVLVILTPQTMTDAAGIARVTVELSKKYNKIVLASWMGASEVERGREILKQGGIPAYAIPETAVRSFLNMYRYGRNLELLYETPPSIPRQFSPNIEDTRALLKSVIPEKRTVLTATEVSRLLANYDIPSVQTGVAVSAEEAASVAAKMGFPVVMKVISTDIIHKTEVGGVRLDIRNEAQAANAFNEIMDNVHKNVPHVQAHSVIVQKKITPQFELFIGSKKDPIWGPVIVFGMGGVAVEVFKDTNTGVPPLNMKLAQRLIEETKIYRLLTGYRKMQKVNIRTLEFLLYKFAYLLMDCPEIKDIDINPFAITGDSGVVLDAKVILDENVMGKLVRPYSHLVICPYPKEYIKKMKLKDGRSVTLRPIRPEDEPLEAEMFTHFSKETQRFRFFRIIKDITHELLVRYTQNDYDREIAIVAELTEKRKKKLAGVVRIIADAYNETAEFAIVVADPWQNLGLGNMFTDYILGIARQRGIHKVYANVLTDNYIMLHIFEKRGFRIEQREEGMSYAELDVPAL